MNPSIAWNAAALFFLSTKTSWVVVLSTDSNMTQWKDLENDYDSPSSWKPSSNLEFLGNQFNNASPENSNDPEKTSSSKHHSTLRKYIEIPHKNKLLSLFHINTCSLNKNFDDLQHLLSYSETFLT